jgi:hypothetical protein
MEDQLSPTSCCIDVLGQGLKAHATLLKGGYGVDQVSKSEFGKP